MRSIDGPAAGSAMRALVLLAMVAMGGSGCSAQVAELGLVAPQPDSEWPLMVLRRNADARVCRTSAFFGLLGRDGSRSLVNAAVDMALRTEPDGNVLADVRVEFATFDVLIYRRQCVRVRGTVAKRVRVVHIH